VRANLLPKTMLVCRLKSRGDVPAVWFDANC
jgi:hypothetical protein